MQDPYSVVDSLVQEIRGGATPDVPTKILALLAAQQICPRQDDGVLRQITISIPLSEIPAYVLGLRYEKRNASQTEDLFVVRPAASISRHYKGGLQQLWPEYAGTHKQQVVYPKSPDFSAQPTMANTATYSYEK